MHRKSGHNLATIASYNACMGFDSPRLYLLSGVGKLGWKFGKITIFIS